MKATGIVRHIDKLGRVVIPKEIRRTMRINNGDTLEIFTDDKQIMFQKYSTMENMGAAVKDMLAALYRTHKMPVIARDREKVVAAKGIGSKGIVNRRITDAINMFFGVMFMKPLTHKSKKRKPDSFALFAFIIVWYYNGGSDECMDNIEYAYQR